MLLLLKLDFLGGDRVQQHLGPIKHQLGIRPVLFAVILKLLPDLDQGQLVAGVSEPLVHLGELRVEAEVVNNVLGVARHRCSLVLQPVCIGIVGRDEPGVLTGQLPQLVLKLLLIALLDLGEDVVVNMCHFSFSLALLTLRYTSETILNH